MIVKPQDHPGVNMAVVIAVGLTAATGQQEVLGVDVGPREDGTFWLGFVRSLVARGLQGVQVVTSDAHQELNGANAAATSAPSPWQDSLSRLLPRYPHQHCWRPQPSRSPERATRAH